MNKAYLAPGMRPVTFDLITLLSVVSICGLVLGVMRGLGFPPHGMLLCSSLLVTVAAARFLLRSFAHPHFGAIAVGFTFALVCESVLRFVQGLPGGFSFGFILLAISYGLFADVLVTASLLAPSGTKWALRVRYRAPVTEPRVDA